MANIEHLALLQQGSAIWNSWREQHRDLQPDLRQADLQGIQIEGVNLTQADLREVNLCGANLSKAKLNKANFNSADLRQANLEGADLSEADLTSADLRKANLCRANLNSANLRVAFLRQANLQQADLSKANLQGANLTGVKLSGAKLHQVSLKSVNLVGVDLSEADLRLLPVTSVETGMHLNDAPIPAQKVQSQESSELTPDSSFAVQQAEYQQSQIQLAEHWQGEAALSKLNEELEARVIERTTELSRVNQQLQAEICKRLQVQRALQESQLCLQLINTISTARITGLSVEKIIERTVSQIQQFFSSLGVSYSTINEQSQLTILHAIAPPGMSLHAGATYDLTVAPEFLNLLRQGEPAIAEDVTKEPVLSPLNNWLQACQTQALLAVPLRHGDQLMGLLSLHSKTQKRWSEYQIGTLIEIADYLSLTLQALRESERQFRAIFDQTFQFIGVLLPDGVLLEANQTALSFAKLKSEHVINRPFWETFWGNISLETQQILKRAIAKAAFGEFVRDEIKVLNPSEEEVTIDFSLKPVKDETGQVVLLILEGRDITELKLAKESLRQSEERFQIALKNTPIFVFNQDVELRYTWVYNPSSVFNVKEIVGKLDTELLPYEDAQRLTKIKSQVLTSGVGTRSETFITVNDKVRYYDLTVEPLRNLTEEVAGITCACVDITDRKMAEESRREAENKEILLREIHHRVKNNLQIISGLLYLQSRYVESKQTLQLLQDSRDRIQSMALIHEQLYGAKNLAKIDFKDYVTSLSKNLFASYALNPKAIVLTVEIEPLWLDVDTSITCGLIINELISNSLKYGFPEGRRGEIAIKFLSIEDSSFNLIVRDTGVGIPENIDFYSAKTLGLRLVRSLATKQLKGTIKLDRCEGTNFQIFFQKKLAR